MPSVTIDEIPEAQADAATRAVYDDIKRTSGTKLVNLIYRHLATIPTALDWAWGNISKDDSYAKLLRAAERLPRHRLCAPLPAAAWRLMGLSDDQAAAMSELVLQYNKTNAINLVAVTCLLRGVPEIAQDAQNVAGDARLHGDRPAGDMGQVQTYLNALVTGDPGISPTMFRNFEQWPAGLAATAAILAPLEATGALAAARQGSLDAARRIAAEMNNDGVAITPLADPAASRRVAASLTLFQQAIITSMLPVGHALADALSGPS